MPRIGKYFKKDGTKVSAHWRSPAGAKTQTALFGVVVLVVLGANGGTGSDSGADRGKDPKPRESREAARYPIKFHRGGEDPKPPKPRSTVSYPIKFHPGGERG
ncbi:hypothetical protein HUT19_40750 [Streptomyces sp. NA02950]|uniref:hypothetical protein n=1 Tax=Streptomyces sp. NA02950 TaxID=2742137 RepID=UPI0015905926|nr:hypothetical protein [Streptomyces sp. NA02950]QKV97219.1 hypothetical protein HUT19_40750 [Streptomyces sp. NA02950]